MQLTHLLAAGLVPGLVSARAAHSRRAVDCDFSTTADSGATCESFAGSWGLSVDDLQKLNPGISCPDLDTSKSYCVIGTVNDDSPATTTQPPVTTLKTSTTTKASSTTQASVTTSQAAPSNSPAMPGLADDCDGFYKVASGDQCDTIAKKFGISDAQFKSWNSEINDGMCFYSFVASCIEMI